MGINYLNLQSITIIPPISYRVKQKIYALSPATDKDKSQSKTSVLPSPVLAVPPPRDVDCVANSQLSPEPVGRSLRVDPKQHPEHVIRGNEE